MEEEVTATLDMAEAVTVAEALTEAGITITGRRMFSSDPPKIYTQIPLDFDVKPEDNLDHMIQVTTAEGLYKLASQVFEDENLHLWKNRLYIKWPKIEMTNSKGHKHIIYNIIVRLTLIEQPEGSTPVLNVNFDGMRASGTVRELNANYTHSHLSSSTGFGRFGSFCLGSSDFALIRQNVCLDPTIANWMLLLMSIENYLSWESLEGGPHIRISQIVDANQPRDIPTSSIDAEASRLIENIPYACIDVPSMKLVVGEIFEDYVDRNSRVRSIKTDSEASPETISMAESKMTLHGRRMVWKDGEIIFAVMAEEKKRRAKEEVKVVDKRIKERMELMINILLTQFKTVYQHEHNKKTRNRAYFTLGETKADRDRRAPKENRLSTHSGTSARVVR